MAGSFTAVSATAQTTGDPVVVTARPLPTRAVVDKWVRDLSIRRSSDEPLSRMNEPLCVATAGLASSVGKLLADRVLSNAQRLKIPLAGGKCRPNVLILFVDNGAAQVDWLVKHRLGMFGDLPYSTIRALRHDPGPVHAWHITAIASRDGDKLVQGEGGFPMLHIPSASRIDAPIQSMIVAAVVLIDRSSIVGHGIDQIADYAAMRTLAVVNPQPSALEGDRTATILSLFRGGDVPAQLTAFDWGYLTGLYSGRATRRTPAQYADMARSIEKELAAGDNKP
ncbi:MULTISPECIES: hypothetical protein [Sphingomonas]|uniref:Uncharacterized protein n=1 Tax=Sphingomonas zeae TaxID=1646122 RepID=A0A7Y6EGN6_9SPHN|nr:MULTISPECIES: hypothetical protein [Sphingomonas]MBB4048230.1 hypothetical protein [Sphingomonas zeae]MDK8186119.1 hypothetical protein [Sphingomonas zeae]MDK8215642.1 hypothetical protein [Sphingomonas sp. UMB7805-LC452B]NUU46640.1 hypothetical protein [Sphingomonas zeae]